MTSPSDPVADLRPHTHPIVGMYYRPPAKALVAVLPVGTRLLLRSDPCGSATGSDHTDPTAIAVFLATTDFPQRAEAAFDTEGAQYGYDTARLREAEEWCLGFIPKHLAAHMHNEAGFPTDRDVVGEFTCTGNASPLVRYTL